MYTQKGVRTAQSTLKAQSVSNDDSGDDDNADDKDAAGG